MNGPFLQYINKLPFPLRQAQGERQFKNDGLLIDRPQTESASSGGAAGRTGATRIHLPALS